MHTLLSFKIEKTKHNTRFAKMPISSGILNAMIRGFVQHEFSVHGSVLANGKKANDIDISLVEDFRSKLHIVYNDVVKIVNNVCCTHFRFITSDLEYKRMPYGTVDFRVNVHFLMTRDNGTSERLNIDITSSRSMSRPVFITNILIAKYIDFHLNTTPPSSDISSLMKYTRDLSVEMNKQHSYITYWSAHGGNIDMLKRIRQLTLENKSGINPHSELFIGDNMPLMLKNIERIELCLRYGKFANGIDFEKAIDITMSHRDICEVRHCNIRRNKSVRQMGDMYVKLACCGVTVCAKYLCKMVTIYDIPVCIFSRERRHFMRFSSIPRVVKHHNNITQWLEKCWDKNPNITLDHPLCNGDEINEEYHPDYTKQQHIDIDNTDAIDVKQCRSEPHSYAECDECINKLNYFQHYASHMKFHRPELILYRIIPLENYLRQYLVLNEKEN
jgi:hypothetical protein